VVSEKKKDMFKKRINNQAQIKAKQGALEVRPRGYDFNLSVFYWDMIEEDKEVALIASNRDSRDGETKGSCELHFNIDEFLEFFEELEKIKNTIVEAREDE
jgi:hypothetical protein